MKLVFLFFFILKIIKIKKNHFNLVKTILELLYIVKNYFLLSSKKKFQVVIVICEVCFFIGKPRPLA